MCYFSQFDGDLRFGKSISNSHATTDLGKSSCESPHTNNILGIAHKGLGLGLSAPFGFVIACTLKQVSIKSIKSRDRTDRNEHKMGTTTKQPAVQAQRHLLPSSTSYSTTQQVHQHHAHQHPVLRQAPPVAFASRPSSPRRLPLRAVSCQESLFSANPCCLDGHHLWRRPSLPSHHDWIWRPRELRWSSLGLRRSGRARSGRLFLRILRNGNESGLSDLYRSSL